jgi:hypothetical protein
LAVDWCTQVAEIGAADLISADDQYLAVAKHRGSVAAPNPRHIRAHAERSALQRFRRKSNQLLEPVPGGFRRLAHLAARLGPNRFSPR